jgi:hypothetical protein
VSAILPGAPSQAAPVCPSAPAAPGPRALVLDVEALTLWARGIARGVREDCNTRHHTRWAPGSAEEEELEGTASVTLAKLLSRYDESRLAAGGDPTGHFKAMASQWIRKECWRHAERLLNAGAYKTARKGQTRGVELPTARERCGNCSEVTLGVWDHVPAVEEVPDDEAFYEDEADEPVVCRAVHLPVANDCPSVANLDGWRAFLLKKGQGARGEGREKKDVSVPSPLSPDPLPLPPQAGPPAE